ncbi:hypothetical protein BFR57_03840 [Idiomarina sp. MD25a]|uniref:amidoligase family protein n=1 Tax=Idiomarina sp. MD25a TaxID=1889913 RepID=UPI0008F87C4B|nr:amidoligase family protein [Idiomarina sp. MD25a]OIM99706.1 hypothetical protein BFR57_03840 [Idiomarina sp. MD25a]
MTQTTINHFKSLQRPETDSGQLRTIGFEIEFNGLSVQQTLNVLQSHLKGQVDHISLAERSIQHEQLGTFHIELDWSYLKRIAREQPTSGTPERIWLEELHALAERMVPMEIVCPPMTLQQCECLFPIVEALREAGAKGTDESWIAAYGVHINPQVASEDSTDVLRYIQAFSLLQWWLFKALKVDTTRKLSPYIDKYPEAYIRQLCKQSEVSEGRLIDDYLRFNASRNRALDMLPLFAHCRPDTVSKAVGDAKVGARPTFHFRLPNCHIERPGWQLDNAWHGWWVVEQLANDIEALDYWKNAFLSADRPLVGVDESAWIDRISSWLHDRAWW